MAFLSGLTPDDYNKKPGDLIKSSDWGMLVSDVIGLGKAKLDRDGDTLHGTLSVAGALTMDGTGHVGNLRITPGSASSGLWLGDVGESNWGVYRRVAGALQSPKGGTAVAGNQFNGQALRIRTAADAASALIVENQAEQRNLSVRGSDGATFVRGALTVGGGEVLLHRQVGAAGGNRQPARALRDGGTKAGLVINPDNDFGKVTVQSELNIHGPLHAAAFIYNNPMVHRMYPADAIIYQDILDALRQGVIAKLGNPAVDSNWDTRYGPQTPWNLRSLVQFGTNNDADGNGAVVTIPAGYDTLWVRVQGTSWNVIKAYVLAGNALQQDLGLWAGGWRSHSICPDGSISDSNGHDTDPAHQWLAIPVGQAGQIALISKQQTNSGLWLSGVGFSRNPWSHAAQASVAYHWQLNGTEAGVIWGDRRHRSDQMSQLPANSNLALQVPVLPNGRDKLLYLIGCCTYIDKSDQAVYHNDIQHTAILVNGQPIERLLATYDNPFARHWNTRPACGYYAARIPATLIPTGARSLKVQIDMSKQQDPIDFREIGTHDLDTPIN
ncbi:MAG: hypothetical protein KGS73_04760 [Chloroflexi bacterium]|nr:hypothetical protein [Chloroflexota bacterium]